MQFPRNFGLGLAVGAGGAAAATLLWQASRSGTSRGSRHPTLKYGSPSLDGLRTFDHFVVAFDPRTKCPSWVLERLSWEEGAVRTGDRKNSEFKEDQSFEERFRSRLADYRGSGYDRGHMAPAGNHKADQKAMRDTFFLTNICPQVGPGFNRDYWARFERFVNQLQWSCDNVFIVTGPLFLPQITPSGMEMRHPVIGEPPNLVSVPTHFYKVVLGECKPGPDGGGEAAGKVAVAAFVMPNAPIDPDVPLTAFAVPLEPLEAVSGLHFFPDLISDERRDFHDHLALSWQQLGRQQLLSQQALRQNPLLNTIARDPADPASRLELADPLSSLAALSRPPPPQAAATSTAARELPVGLLEKGPPILAPPPPASSVTVVEVEEPVKPTSLVGNNRQHSQKPASKQPVREPLAPLPSASHSTPQLPEPSIPGQEAEREGQESAGKLARKRHSKARRQPGEEHVLGSINLRPLAGTGASEFGMLHLCDHTKCVLPPPDWYLKRKAEGEAKRAKDVKLIEEKPAK